MTVCVRIDVLLQEPSFSGMDNVPDSVHTEPHIPLSPNPVTLIGSTPPEESPLSHKCSQIQLEPYSYDGDGTYHNGENPRPAEATGSNKEQFDDT